MPALIRRYCGMSWYFSNSATQDPADSGGRIPVTGCHSVIDRPDKVSRVMPPITTITKIMPQQQSSQRAMGRRLGTAAVSARGLGSAIAVGSDKRFCQIRFKPPQMPADQCNDNRVRRRCADPKQKEFVIAA